MRARDWLVLVIAVVCIASAILYKPDVPTTPSRFGPQWEHGRPITDLGASANAFTMGDWHVYLRPDGQGIYSGFVEMSKNAHIYIVGGTGTLKVHFAAAVEPDIVLAVEDGKLVNVASTCICGSD